MSVYPSVCLGMNVSVYHVTAFPLCCVSLQQKDVRSDPLVVQEVSAATDYLLENLGALAVEVGCPCTHTHTVQTKIEQTHSHVTSAVFGFQTWH